MEYYDIIAVGAGAGGVFLTYELHRLGCAAKILVLEKGAPLEERFCPIKMGKTEKCVRCASCKIMNGYGGAGTLSDGKYNITTRFGGDLHKYVGEKKAMELMEYVDHVLTSFGGEDAKLYSTANSELKTMALRNNLHLLEAKVRHLGTDRNRKILERLYDYSKEQVETRFYTEVLTIDRVDETVKSDVLKAGGAGSVGTVERDEAERNDADNAGGAERDLPKAGGADGNGVAGDGFRFIVATQNGEKFACRDVVLATGRSGSKWMSQICEKFQIPTESNRVDIGVRVELPAEIFKHITDDVYESKLVYKTDQYNDVVRTFCMNPYGEVVAENTNGIITVNGHSYADAELHTENTNFALLVTNQFTEPFNDSNEYGESIARLSNMLGGGVLLQRFGDLIKGRRSSERRMEKCYTRPTLKATPGDLSLVIPKRQLDDIIEMIYALDKIAPGTANEDTLLYGVEVKFYNSKVQVDENMETNVKGIYTMGDGSGVTHSLSQASACGVLVARALAKKYASCGGDGKAD